MTDTQEDDVPKAQTTLYDFPVTNRFTGAVQFTAKIEADPSVPFGIRMGLAVKWGVRERANLSGADLSRANLSGANLSGAYLSRADLSGAYLSRADLSRADLSRANLSGANLSGANLSGANLSGAYLSGAYLSGADLSRADLSGAYVEGEPIVRLIASLDRLNDPYRFLAFEMEAGGVKIKAGCRWFAVAEFRTHVADEYPDTPKAEETLRILDFIEGRAGDLGVALEAPKAEAA